MVKLAIAQTSHLEIIITILLLSFGVLFVTASRLVDSSVMAW
jgi:hypothetical protein